MIMKRGILLILFAQWLYAIPFFSRKFNISCTECHAGYPKLTYEGEKLKENLYLPQNFNPRLQTMDLKGDRKIYLQRDIPISGRIRTLMGLVAMEKKFYGHTSTYATVYASSNMSSNSSFFVAVEGGKDTFYIREAFFRINLPLNSSAFIGKTDLSEFFFKRYNRITYEDYSVYDFAGLNGTGITLRFSPYIWLGFIDVERGIWFGRAGLNSKYFSFGVFGIPKNNAQRYGSDIRFRFGPFDFITSVVFGFDQELGSFERNENSFVAGYSALDMVFGYNFFISLLYNYIGSFHEPHNKDFHKSIITLAFGHYPLRNLRAGIEVGYNTAAKYPANGTYGGITLDWAF